jgi:hypothetical protein
MIPRQVIGSSFFSERARIGRPSPSKFQSACFPSFYRVRRKLFRVQKEQLLDRIRRDLEGYGTLCDTLGGRIFRYRYWWKRIYGYWDAKRGITAKFTDESSAMTYFSRRKK